MTILPRISLQNVRNGQSLCLADAIALQRHALRPENALTPGTEDHKFFFEEFQPAMIVALHLGDIENLEFGGRHDGIDCRLFGPNQDISLEVSAAIDGHQDSLQLEYLSRFGEVSLFDHVDFSGTKRQRKFREQDEVKAYCWQTELAPELQKQMHKTISRKIDKARTRPLYSGAFLAVVMDDYKYAFVETDKLERLDPICRCSLIFQQGISVFPRIFLAGKSGNYLFDSKDMRGRLITTSILANRIVNKC